MGKLIKNKIKNEAKPIKNKVKVPHALSGKLKLKSKSLKTKRKVITSPVSVHEQDNSSTESDLKENSVSYSENTITTNTFNVEESAVKSGIQALFKLIELHKSKKKNNELFDDELPIFLQISCIRIPKCPVRTVRLQLKNPLVKSASEICLITANLRNGARRDHDKTIEHYENLLRLKDVNNIKTIMPLHQLKTEYDQYELKRKLITQYDMFLVEGKVSKTVAHLLGKIFKDKRRLPIPIKLHVSKLKEHLESALTKTLMNIHPYGDNYTVQIAHTDMSEKEIYENITAIWEELAKNLPGGKENVRALHLKSSSTMSVPIYYSLKKACEVPVPIVPSKRPKNFKIITGSFLNKRVTVNPGGLIKVSKQAKNFNDEDGGENISYKENEQDRVNVAGRYVKLGKPESLKRNVRKHTKQRSRKVVKKRKGFSDKNKSQNKKYSRDMIKKTRNRKSIKEVIKKTRNRKSTKEVIKKKRNKNS